MKPDPGPDEVPADVVLLVDGEGVVRYMTPGAGPLLGARGAPEGSPVVEVLGVQAGERDALAAGLEDLRRGRRRRLGLELRVQGMAGSWRVLALSGESLLDVPDVGRIVLHLTDVTTRRDLEEQLRRSQRMKAVGRLAGGVAHEFRNALTVIRASAELARASVAEDGDVAEELAEIAAAADRATALTDQLLSFRGRGAALRGPCDLNQVIEGLRPLLTRLLGEAIRLALELTPRLEPVAAEPGQVEQVLLELATNARDAMRPGGTLLLRTSTVHVGVPDGVLVLGLEPGRYAVLEVTDDGSGMSPETLSHVFEPFFTTRPDLGRAGLGLATVYGIATGCGGQVHVRSEPGAGTLFRVYLPLATPPG